MANTLLTISMITREALRILENNLTFAKQVSRQYDSRFAKSGAKIGNTLDIRKPPKYRVRTGQAIDIQDATETSVPLVLDNQIGVDIQFSSTDLALNIDDFSDRFIKPALAPIANKIDYDGLQEYLKVHNVVGTWGTVPTGLLTYLQAKQRLAEEAAPVDDMLAVVISPEMEATLVNGLTGLFHDSKEVSSQYKDGNMGRAAGFKFSMDQNVPTHTNGTFTTGSTPLVNGASQSGSSIVTDGWANSTLVLQKGDIITFAGANAVYQQSRQDAGFLKQFVVTEDVTSDGSGNATIPISPSLNPSANDPFRTCTASPANNAAITPFGTEAASEPQGLAFHRDAFALGCADLPLPKGTDMASRMSDSQLGMSVRMIRNYDISTDNWPCRLDILYGWTTLYPELAVRIAS